MTFRAIKAEGLGFFWVKGADSVTFLQGQSTPDIRSMPEGTVVIGAFLDPKGRVRANGWFAKGKEGILVVIAEELIADLLTHLQRFVLRAKVEFEQVLDPSLWLIETESGENKTPLDKAPMPGVLREEAAGWTLHFPENLQLWHCPAQDLPSSLTLLRGMSTGLMLTKNGIALITAATKEAFLPQMIDLEHLGGISYSKGCYTGQEIVTRTHFLGKVKRALYTVASDLDGHWMPGSPIHDPVSGEISGTLLQGDVLPGGGFVGLACLSTLSNLTRLSLDGSPLTATRARTDDADAS